MRLTIHHSLTGQGDMDLEVACATALSEVVGGLTTPSVWCGTVEMAGDHEAGEWPLVAGAILSAYPLRTSLPPHALHLAAIAGPDAGVIIPLEFAAIIGSAPPSAVVRDDAIDASHATAAPRPGGAIRVRDNGSVNGTGVWSLRGGTPTWRGRRRETTIHVGDVIVIGRTFLEARQWLPPAEAIAARPHHARGWARRLPRVALASRAALAALLNALSHARLAAARVPCPPNSAWSRAAPPAASCPDPTRSEGWSEPIAIGGPHAVDLARAVILARGRMPPLPLPLDEPWMSWLPPGLPGDGLIRIGAAPTTRSEREWTLLGAEPDRTTSSIAAVMRSGPIVRVSADTADALARSRAGSLPEPASRTLHWADAAALAPQPSASRADLGVVAGVLSDDPSLPWTIAIGQGSRHTLVAGAACSGKTTLLATIAGALAIAMPPEELALVILCARAPGALQPYLNLPHARAAASHVRPSAALRVMSSLDFGAALTVIIADDIDALGPDGRAVTARLEAIGAQDHAGRVHVVMATRRPTAVLTPSLRAAGGTAVALRAQNDADSLEVIGIGAAADIPIDSPGMALVRTAGRVYGVQAALPFADGLPRVRRCDGPAYEATSLAAAARAAAGSTRQQRPDRLGQTRPAS